jgi:hypothetical protein
LIKQSIIYRFVFVIIFVLAQVLFTGCASMNSLAFLWGGETDTTTSNDPSRKPASVDDETLSVDNTRAVENEVIESVKKDSEVDSFGSTPSANEFSNLARRNSESSKRGFRRQAGIWDGIENQNEGSLWNPDNQNNFYFSRNLLYSVGDLITLDFEPEMSEVLNTRLTAIYKPLLKTPPQDVVAREVSQEAGKKVEAAVGQAVKNEAIGAAMGEAVQDKTVSTLSSPKKRYFTSKDMTLRVLEVTSRGLLKVEGSKKLFLKNASFDLKVAGMLRETDITANKRIASSQLMDSKVEIIK